MIFLWLYLAMAVIVAFSAYNAARDAQAPFVLLPFIFILGGVLWPLVLVFRRFLLDGIGAKP